MAKIIYTDGTIQDVSPKNGKDFSLEEVQMIVGGFIEIVKVEGEADKILVINEEGKLNGLPLNPVASYLYGCDSDCIVGTALYCNSNEIK